MFEIHVAINVFLQKLPLCVLYDLSLGGASVEKIEMLMVDNVLPINVALTYKWILSTLNYDRTVMGCGCFELIDDRMLGLFLNSDFT